MKRVGGFTLLEMVVAIGIFSIVAAISYASLNRFLDARDIISLRQAQLRSLQSAMTLMEQDMRFMVNRPVRDGFGDEEGALVSAGALELAAGEIVRLTTSQPHPSLPAASQLRRVAWRLVDGELQRVTWAVLDRDQDSQEFVRTLVRSVDLATIQYLSYDGGQSLQSDSEWTNTNTLPVGVEFELTLRDGRQFRRLFAITGNT